MRQVRLASVQDLGWLPSNSVDKILHFNCVYFWQDLAGALAELLRVLKPQGLMLAGTKFGEIQKHFAGGERPLDAGFININETEFVQAMVSAGFTNVHERKVPSPGPQPCSLLSYTPCALLVLTEDHCVHVDLRLIHARYG